MAEFGSRGQALEAQSREAKLVETSPMASLDRGDHEDVNLPVELPLDSPSSKRSGSIGCGGGLWGSSDRKRGIVTRLQEKIKGNSKLSLFLRRGKENQIEQLQNIQIFNKGGTPDDGQNASPMLTSPNTPYQSGTGSSASTSPRTPGLDSEAPSPQSVLPMHSRYFSGPISTATRKSLLSGSRKKGPPQQTLLSRFDSASPSRRPMTPTRHQFERKIPNPCLMHSAPSPKQAWRAVKRTMTPTRRYHSEKPLLPPKKLSAEVLAAAGLSGPIHYQSMQKLEGLDRQDSYEFQESRHARRASLSGLVEYFSYEDESVADWHALLAAAARQRGEDEQALPPLKVPDRRANWRPTHQEKGYAPTLSDSSSSDEEELVKEIITTQHEVKDDQDEVKVDQPESRSSRSHRTVLTAAASLGARKPVQEWHEVNLFKSQGYQSPKGGPLRKPARTQSVPETAMKSLRGVNQSRIEDEDKGVAENEQEKKLKAPKPGRIEVPEVDEKKVPVISPVRNGGWDAEIRTDFSTAAAMFRSPARSFSLPAKTSPKPPLVPKGTPFDTPPVVTRGFGKRVCAPRAHRDILVKQPQVESQQISEAVLLKLRPDLAKKSTREIVPETGLDHFGMGAMRPDTAGGYIL